MLWTKEEIELLSKHYPYKSIEQLNLLFPNRTCQSLRMKASNLGIKKKIICNPIYQQWSEEEVDRLMEKYPVVHGEDLWKLFPNRTRASVNLKAYNSGFRKKDSGWRIIPVRGRSCKYLGCLEKLIKPCSTSYYWMGFLIADGHFGNNFVTISLSSKDELHLKKLADFLGCHIRVRKNIAVLKIRDKNAVQLIKEKFNLNHRKTYCPIDVKIIDDMDEKLFESLVVGFIDGDGHLRKQPRRKDSIISIKLHSSWLNILQCMTNKLYGSLKLSPPKAKINKAGYSLVHWGHWEIIKKLLSVTEEENLPVLERKWSVIDKTYEPKYVRFNEKREKTLQLLKDGYNGVVIAEMLSVSGAYVYKVKKELN